VAPRLDPDRSRAAGLAVVRRLKAAGHVALFAGGCVRDRLLRRPPVDHDVATSARPEEAEALFPGAVTVGARFGVVVANVDAVPVQIATFRSDGAYVDGRRPDSVTFSDPPTDASRRDFTVNGLFEDPTDGEGRVLDYVGGLPDLRARLLRAIGDPEARFSEDHLRLLRAVRFAVQLGFAIEPRTFAAVKRLAPLAATVSPERTRDELVKALRHGRGRALRLLRASGLLDVLLPEIAAGAGVPQPPQYHPEGDVFVHTCLVLDRLDLAGRTEDEEEALLLGALLHDVGKPPTMSVDDTGRVRFNGHDAKGAEMTEALLDRLRFPNRRKEVVRDLVAKHMLFPSLPKMRPNRVRTFLGAPEFPLHLSLHRADCGGSHGDLSLAAYCLERLEAFANEPVLPPPLLRGQDLLAAGYRAGPRLGRILAWIRERQLDGEVSDPADAVRRVQAEFPPDPPEA
jgi:poly(A) polymerase